ncbi:MAG: pyrroline-5-carboxylate reductase [Anaerolineales bacterium]|jgi:pyrroline-5-carboxylate reductase
MMLEKSKAAFIGSGVMGEAMIKGLLTGKLMDPARITAADIRPERGQELKQRYGISFAADNAAAVDGADVVVLSVKPQVLPEVMPSLQGRVPKGALVLSIIAGAKLSGIVEGLAHASVVRAMPNTPAQIGEGMTVWTSSPSVTEIQKGQAKQILGALGVEVYVEDEDLLDVATALSGSGPAYVFLFMEALVDAGVHLGFSRQLAEQLVLQTVKGSVDYAMHTSQHLARLRNQVTSPGGTTAEAMYYLEKAGFRTAISRAVWAAFQRSVELGKGKKRSDLEKD